jgi:hypothetical protein
VQAVNAALSSEHLNVAPVGSVEVKLKLALVAFVGFAGFDVIIVSGAVVSTVQVKLAGLASVLPAASVAATWKVWDPCTRPVYACGLVHAALLPSSEQLNVEPAFVEVNWKLALVTFVGFAGFDVIIVSGAVVSMVQL